MIPIGGNNKDESDFTLKMIFGSKTCRRDQLWRSLHGFNDEQNDEYNNNDNVAVDDDLAGVRARHTGGTGCSRLMHQKGSSSSRPLAATAEPLENLWKTRNVPTLKTTSSTFLENLKKS